MADITLVNTYNNWQNFPLGMLSIGAALEKQNVSVDIRDCALEKLNLQRFLCLLKNSAKIIGLGCSLNSLPEIIYYLKHFKERNKNKIIILGGPGPSSVHAEIVKNFPWIDIVIRGEAEEVIYPILKAILSGEDWNALKAIPGVTFIRANEIHASKSAACVKDLNLLPLINYRKLNLNSYDSISFETSRGCIGQCTPCSLRGNFRRKNIERIGEELAQIKRSGVGRITLVDNTFNVDHDFIVKFCKTIKKIKLSWACSCRVNDLNELTLKDFFESGCREIFFGIESGSDYVLREINKGHLVNDVLRVVPLAIRYIPLIRTSFMWGFPFEKYDDFLATIELSLYLEKLGAKKMLNVVSPIPNTSLYLRYKDRLRFYPYRLTPSFIWPKLFFDHKREKKELIRLIKKYPSVFPFYYTYFSRDLKKKIDFMLKSKIDCGWDFGPFCF